MAGTKMTLRRQGNELIYWHEQETVVDEHFLASNNGLFIALQHKYVMGKRLLDVYLNGQLLAEGGGYEEINEETIKLDLGLYPPGHAMAGQAIPLALGDEIYIRIWKSEYSEYGGYIDSFRFQALEQEIIQSRKDKNTQVSHSTLNERLNQIQELAECKTIVMVLSKVRAGTSQFEIRFPYEGIITDVYASCAKEGVERSVFQVELCSQKNYILTPKWENIFTQDLIIDAHEKSSLTSSEPHSMRITRVKKDDHFRVRVTEVGQGIEGVTIEIMIRL